MQPDSIPLEALRPTHRNRVIDLVREAGVDVSEWSNCQRGEAGASSNPKYCYEWVFVEPKKTIVLNLWHSQLKEDAQGRIIHEDNFRADADYLTKQRRGDARARRAARQHEAIQTALRENLAVRVILNDGLRRLRNEPDAKSSKVKLRALDPEFWSIAAYDDATGVHQLIRGKSDHLVSRTTETFVDQFSANVGESGPAKKRDQSGSIFARSGKVRNSVLTRAEGRCEYCGTEGFRMANGSIYLETHHIVPLHEGGPDHTENVIALCPNDHRKGHLGEEAQSLGESFLKLVRNLNSAQ